MSFLCSSCNKTQQRGNLVVTSIRKQQFGVNGFETVTEERRCLGCITAQGPVAPTLVAEKSASV